MNKDFPFEAVVSLIINQRLVSVVEISDLVDFLTHTPLNRYRKPVSYRECGFTKLLWSDEIATALCEQLPWLEDVKWALSEESQIASTQEYILSLYKKRYGATQTIFTISSFAFHK